MKVKKWFHPDKSIDSKLQLHMYYVAGLIHPTERKRHVDTYDKYLASSLN